MTTVGSVDVNLTPFGNMINNSSELGASVTQGVSDQGDIITGDLSNSGILGQNVKTIELTINAKSGKSLIVPRQIESFIEGMKSIITNSDRTVFHRATNANIADVKAQIELPDRNRTISINQEELQLREVMPLEDSPAVNNNRLNGEYIFDEAISYGLSIANKYRRLFGE